MPDLTPIGRRLRQTEVKGYRERTLGVQQNKCALCGEDLTTEEAVLDHDHKTGRIRGVIHRSCNALLGKIENNYRRCGLNNLGAFIQGTMHYIGKEQAEVFHPSYRTAEEKRVRRNKKAKRARAKSKEQVSAI